MVRYIAQRAPSCSRNAARSAAVRPALAASHSVRTTAFPAISCGVYGYPWEDAVRIAVRECTAGLERHAEIERITFACFDDAMLMMYEKALAQVNE
jgi:O-acetyl-ADP-ribose deacetylase (regulator of RNase III)